MPAITKIALVDDHQMLRDGLRLVLQRESDFQVVGEAGTIQAAMECLPRWLPDLVILDIHLPDGNGIMVAAKIRAAFPDTKILMLSGHPDLNFIQSALQAGAAGYLLKDEAADELVRAVHAVMAGKSYLSPAAATVLVRDLQTAKNAPPSKPDLSERESQVLKLVAAGLRNKEIASQLGLGVKSIETYRARLMKKLGCTGTAELVRYAVREGLVSS